MARSDAGHDKGKLYVILKVEGENVLLVDGLHKTLEKPKKKNIRHVRRMNYIDPEIDARLNGNNSFNLSLYNEDIRKAIQLYEARCNVIGG
jgi:ribosomal protein L14E/L6E/L27E